MIIEREEHTSNKGVAVITTHKGERFPFEYAKPEVFYSVYVQLKNGESWTFYKTEYKQALKNTMQILH